MGNRRLEVLAYANDIVQLEKDKKSLIELTQKILITAKRVGLEINDDKTNYMIFQRREILDYIHAHLEVSAYRFKRVRELKYLSSILTEKMKNLLK